MEIKENLRLLIEKYFAYKKDNKSIEMSEESTRSWINEFLKIFGWDVLNTQQIQQEKIFDDYQKERLSLIDSSHTKPDYSLMNGNNIKSYLDAKKPNVDIFKSKESAFQIRSYGWSACVPCAFLTNFEQLVIFDCRYAPNKEDEANLGAIQISIEDYIKEFDLLNNHFNRLLVYNNNLYKLYNVEKRNGDQTLDTEFNNFLSDFRLELANNIYELNPDLIDIEDLNYYVQIILDRIIFIRVCEAKGFDFVIGNPPYVETKYFKASSKTIHEYLHTNYNTFEGKVDLSVLFLERCMSLLNYNGILGMIIQRRWFKTNYGKSAREYITNGKHLRKLLDIGTNALFKGRITYVSIIVLSNNQNNKIEYDFIKGDISDIQLYFEKATKPQEIEASYFSSDIWAPEQKQIFEIKNKYAKKYGTIGSNKDISICDGIQALWKKVYDIVDFSINENTIIGKNKFGEKVIIEKEMVKPVIYNTAFLPLKEITPNAYRIFPYKGDDHKTKISIDEIKNKYPLAYDYLSRYKELILKTVRHNSGNYWHTYTREHNHDSFESAKIIIPMTAKETYATFVSDKGLYMDNSNVWFINVRNNDQMIMKALTMIINSTLFSVFGKCGANPASNGYYKFNKQFIEPIPLPNSKLKNGNEFVIRLIKLYEEIKELLKEYEKSNQHNKQFYKSSLENKWDEVDNCCFEMYEINENERNIIMNLGRIESRIPNGD